MYLLGATPPTELPKKKRKKNPLAPTLATHPASSLRDNQIVNTTDSSQSIVFSVSSSEQIKKQTFDPQVWMCGLQFIGAIDPRIAASLATLISGSSFPP